MSDTTYVDFVQPAVSAEWLNEINDHVWHDTPVSGSTVHDANKINTTPFGYITATNVQAALNEITADLAASSGSTLVGFLQEGISAVDRTTQEKLGELPSVLDFGAIGDGVTDDITAFVNAAAAITGPVLVPPNKQYVAGGDIAFQYGIGFYDIHGVADTPYDTLHINRQVSSVGTTAEQVGGAIVRSSLAASVEHNEFGFFSVLDSSSTDVTVEHVGMYSQATSNGAGASALWAGVFEVRNTTPIGGGTSADHVLCGIEVDVVNNKAFSDINRKIGVEVIGFGGFESTDGFSVHAGAGTWANGTYLSGGWRYGLRIYDQSINATLGSGVWIDSDHARGLHITGKSSGAAIDLDADAVTTYGMIVRSNYDVPISIQPDKQIRLAHGVAAYGISYATPLQAVVLTAPAIGVTGHITYPTATAGVSGATPAQVSGYLGVYVNGTLRKVPFYNA